MPLRRRIRGRYFLSTNTLYLRVVVFLDDFVVFIVITRHSQRLRVLIDAYEVAEQNKLAKAFCTRHKKAMPYEVGFRGLSAIRAAKDIT